MNHEWLNQGIPIPATFPASTLVCAPNKSTVENLQQTARCYSSRSNVLNEAN